MHSEFFNLITPYLSNETYQRLLQYRHHNTTRLNHLYNVAVYSYWIGKKLNCLFDVDFEALIAGALLHDFHFIKQGEYKEHHCRNTHGTIASNNAIQVFNVSKKEQNIIEAHMFPLVWKWPKSKEAWIVSFSDKLSAFMEVCLNTNHQIPELIYKSHEH